MFQGAVDRVGLEADLPAGLHLIILREDDVIAVADFFLVKGHGNIAVGVRLQGGDGLYRPVRVIGGDMVHEIRICFPSGREAPVVTDSSRTNRRASSSPASTTSPSSTIVRSWITICRSGCDLSLESARLHGYGLVL